jgi:hypothetical protein
VDLYAPKSELVESESESAEGFIWVSHGIRPAEDGNGVSSTLLGSSLRFQIFQHWIVGHSGAYPGIPAISWHSFQILKKIWFSYRGHFIVSSTEVPIIAGLAA